MRRRLLVAAGILMLAVLGAITAWAATPRHARIYMNKNRQNSTAPGRYASECLGAITVETIGANRGDTVTWHIKHGNGHNGNDKCDMFDGKKVSLHFKEAIWANPGNPTMPTDTLASTNGSTIVGTVDQSATRGKHGYGVYYDNKVAGPDPELVIDCDSCGGK